MLGSAMLDVAIGVVFVYLLLSLICSAFNELLETKLKNRASDLEKGIKGLLGENTGLVEKIYNHGLIFSLYRGTYAEASQEKTLPSYIPSQNFAAAITGILGTGHSPAPTPETIRAAINNLKDEQIKSALVTLLNDAGTDLQKFRASFDGWFRNSAHDLPAALTGILDAWKDAPPSLDFVRASIRQIANEQVQSALLTILDDAGDDLQKFRSGLESWFNSAMDRVSGWYKRRAHVIIFSMGFAIAVAMNVNSISLAQDLWTNQATREALVGAAQGYYDKHSASAPTSTSSQQGSPASPAANAPNLDQGLKADIDELKSTNIPLGWTHKILGDFRAQPLLIGAALLGWFLTACAASLGAPFWFDVLGKFIVVRTSVKPGEKSAPAPSKS